MCRLGEVRVRLQRVDPDAEGVAYRLRATREAGRQVEQGMLRAEIAGLQEVKCGIAAARVDETRSP